MKKCLLSVVVSTATLLGGCNLIPMSGSLYPVQGPAIAQNPPPIYSIVAHGAYFDGSLNATLANNELCSGTWHQVDKNDTTAGQMSVQWDQVYGPGFFVARILGNPTLSRGALTCKQGTTLNIEFFHGEGTGLPGATGIAQDNKGNLYKVTF